MAWACLAALSERQVCDDFVLAIFQRGSSLEVSDGGSAIASHPLGSAAIIQGAPSIIAILQSGVAGFDSAAVFASAGIGGAKIGQRSNFMARRRAGFGDFIAEMDGLDPLTAGDGIVLSADRTIGGAVRSKLRIGFTGLSLSGDGDSCHGGGCKNNGAEHNEPLASERRLHIELSYAYDIDDLPITIIHIRMDDWSDYLVCLTVAEAGSFTAAATELGVSQPTVTRRMQALEDRLGEPLFERENGKTQLTSLGRRIVSHAKRMREEASAIHRAAIAQDQSLSGLVVVSASEGLGADWLPGALAGFQANHPAIAIEIVIKNHPANLADREADIALRWNGPGTQQSLVGRRGATVGAGLYASKAYLDKHGRPQSVEDLADHACVAWSLGDYFGWPNTEQGTPVLPGRIAFKANSPASHIKGVEAGFGIGITSHRLARPCRDVEQVLPDFTPALDLWVVAHETVRKSARIRAAFDHIIAEMKRDTAYFRDGAPSKISQP